jgi:outer membrane protein assembly factor BamD (BamD/ComL family)
LAIVVQGDDSSAERIKKLRVFLQQFPQSLYATAVRTSSERLKSHLAQKAKEKKLTEDEKELYELLRLNN